ncbi:MAG: FtsX-like permease family protein [Lachnospiraceae bacterium]|nr:FtsX-like permease family protein [Lachnospiraceae bacterium]
MNKELLLAKSNFRKNRGTSIGIFLLMLLAALLLSLALMIALDVKPTAEKEAKRLEAGDGYFLVQTIDEGIDEAYMRNLLDEKTTRQQYTECIYYNFSQSVPFGDGKLSKSLVINDKRVFDNEYDRVEIVTEDKSITAPYIYVPYQLHTSGGFNVGDEYPLQLSGGKQNLKIRGFINTSFFGCNNAGPFQFVMDDESYAELCEIASDCKALLVNVELTDGVKWTKLTMQIGNRFSVDNDKGSMDWNDIESTLNEKTFMSDILLISFLMVTVIIILVTSLMLSNCIKNYIRENMTNLGALKAMGFTSGNLKVSLLIMFTVIATIGSMIGAALSYLLVPVMAGVFEGQAGVPYKMSFNPATFLVSLGFILVFTVLVTFIAARRLKKIEVVTAFRDGIDAHNFKKNRVALDKTSLPLNMSLSLKTLFTNLKQNITTFFVTGLLVFVCVIGLLMYENFNRNPKLEILSFETCGGIIGVDNEYAPEVEKLLKDEGAKNVRYLMNMYFKYKDEEVLNGYVARDVDSLNNKDVLYKGRFPKYDNEIAIGGKFCKLYGYEIGDEVELNYGDNTYSYLITGLVQTCNDDGRESIMSEDAAAHLINKSDIPAGIWFDVDNKEDAQRILDAASEKFGDKLATTLNFYDVIDGAMTTFRTITTLMLTIMITISAAVIMLILFLFIKSLLYNKRKDYGIYKSLGYTSKDLILQTAGSFMPTVILSVIIFSILSYFLANPYMQTIMFHFGLMKCTFTIPVAGVIMIGAGLIALAFFFAVFQARKIRKIEPYNMLTEN